MTFYSVFVNLRKKCALDCCIITYLKEINHNSPIAEWMQLSVLALKRCGFETVAFKNICFFHFSFDLLVPLSLFLICAHLGTFI